MGAQFLCRESATDVGYRVIVTALAEDRPGSWVVVRAIPNPEREPTPHDLRTDIDVRIEWRTLTQSGDEQRHRTARVIVKSFNDEDGWIEFERIPDVDTTQV